MENSEEWMGRVRLECAGTRAETRFRLSPKRTSPFKSAGASFHSTTGSRGVRISGSNAGTPCSEVVWRVLATHSIRQFSLHFSSRASPCAIRFQTHCTTEPPTLWTRYRLNRCRYNRVRLYFDSRERRWHQAADNLVRRFVICLNSIWLIYRLLLHNQGPDIIFTLHYT
jgi:hypothetical protein